MRPDLQRGVLTFCYGPDKYRQQALALARSIRLHSPDTALAVATDRPAGDFAGLFDTVIPHDFGAMPGTTAKLHLHEITPFDTTLFIDSDCLCLRRIDRLWDFFGAQDFAVFGANRPDFPWDNDPPWVRSLVDAPDYPAFNGGLYFFRRSPLAEAVFARARDFHERAEDLGLASLPRGPHNDEMLVSLAMASLGLRATITDSIVPILAPEMPARELELDVLAGHCRFLRRGEMIAPEIIHFVGRRDGLAAYRRERWVLRHIAFGHWPRAARGLFHIGAHAWRLAGRVRVWLARLR